MDHKGVEAGIYTSFQGINLNEVDTFLSAFNTLDWESNESNEDSLGFAKAEGMTFHITSPEKDSFDVKMGIETSVLAKPRLNGNWYGISADKVRNLICAYCQSSESSFATIVVSTTLHCSRIS